MARPQVVIEWSQFDKLCAIHATQKEIASWFNCSVDTIERAVKRKWKMGFAEYYEQKAGKGKISLRRKQYEMAIAGDRTMLIWLGKQYLGQTEKADPAVADAAMEGLSWLLRMTPEQRAARLALLNKTGKDEK